MLLRLAEGRWPRSNSFPSALDGKPEPRRDGSMEIEVQPFQPFFPMPTREAWVKTCENSGHQLDSVRFLLLVQGGSGGNLQILMMNRKDFLSMGLQT